MSETSTAAVCFLEGIECVCVWFMQCIVW